MSRPDVFDDNSTPITSVTRRNFLLAAGAAAAALTIGCTSEDPLTEPSGLTAPQTTPSVPIRIRPLTKEEIPEQAQNLINEAWFINSDFDHLLPSQDRSPLLERTRTYLFRKFKFYQEALSTLGLDSGHVGRVNDGLSFLDRSFDLNPDVKAPDTMGKFTLVNGFLDGMISGILERDRRASRTLDLTSFNDIDLLLSRIKFDDHSRYPFLEEEDLRTLSRDLRFLEKTRLNLPNRVFVGGQYDLNILVNLRNAVAMYKGANPGYHLGDFYARTNPKLLDDFTKANREALAPGRIARFDLTLAQRLHALPVSERAVFMTALGVYVESGDKFRERKLYAMAMGFFTEAGVLDTQYDVIRSYAGIESSQAPSVRGAKSVLEGEIYRVRDYPIYSKSTTERGILLREKPTLLYKNPLWPSVDDGDLVRVQNGRPVVATGNDDRAEAAKMYYVQAGLKNRRMGFNPDPDRFGWMSVEYLTELFS